MRLSIITSATTCLVVAVAALVASISTAPQGASAALPAAWASECNFSSTSYAYPPKRLIADSYSARGESRAITVKENQPWKYDGLMIVSTTPGLSCMARMEWRGMVSPFWLSSLVSGGASDATLQPPMLANIDPSDLDWFARCEDSIERINVVRMKVTVTDISVSGGTWATSAGVNATVPSGSKCPVGNSSELAPFLRLFAVVDGTSEEIVLDMDVERQKHNHQTIWVREDIQSACPIHFGAILDGSICPGTVTFNGAIAISFEITLTAEAVVALNWFLYVPTLIPLGLGIIFLLFFAALAPKPARLPSIPSPDRASPSIALAIAKISFIVATVVSGVTLAIVLGIDQNRAPMDRTSDAIIMMGSMFALCCVMLIAVAGMLAGKEHKKLNSMPVFVVTWLRLASRSLALGSTCVAWYRGYQIIGIVFVVLQFVIEIGFWANLATTFSGSHEPLRFGVPGDQMLVLSEVGLALMFVPFVGVIASAASRVMCTLEMAERFAVNPKAGEDGSNPEDDATELDPIAQQPALTPVTVSKSKKSKEGKRSKKNKTKKSKSSSKKKKNPRQQIYEDDSSDDEDEGEEEEEEGDQTAAAAAAADDENSQQEDENDFQIDRLPFALFPVENTGALAGAFEGALSARWWVILMEVFGMAILSVCIAIAHPPYVPFALLHALVALGHFGAGFGGIAGTPHFSEVDCGFGAVLGGDIRETCATATGCSLAHPNEGGVLAFGDDLSVLTKRKLQRYVGKDDDDDDGNKEGADEDGRGGAPAAALPEPLGASATAVTPGPRLIKESSAANLQPSPSRQSYLPQSSAAAAAPAPALSAQPSSSFAPPPLQQQQQQQQSQTFQPRPKLPTRDRGLDLYDEASTGPQTGASTTRSGTFGNDFGGGGGGGGAARYGGGGSGSGGRGGGYQQQQAAPFHQHVGAGANFSHMDSIDERVRALAAMSQMRPYEQ